MQNLCSYLGKERCENEGFSPFYRPTNKNVEQQTFDIVISGGIQG